MADRTPIRQAAILVGGRGTRLGSLTDATPKPLMPCGDRPFLAWLLRELTRFGIEDVLLLTGYLSDVVEAALPAIRRTLAKPLRITCIRETQPAGTGGALYNARSHLAERFLLCNGDSWLDCNLGRLLGDAARDPADNIGRMLLRRLDDASRYGVVETEGGLVIAFRERPVCASGTAMPGTINAGVYVFDRRVLVELAPVCSLEREVMPALAGRGVLRGTVADGYFIDIGIPDDLRRAQTELPARLLRPALFVDWTLVADRHQAAGDSVDGFVLRHDVVQTLRSVGEAGWHVFLYDSQADGAALEAGVPGEGRLMRLRAALCAAGVVIDDLCTVDVATGVEWKSDTEFSRNAITDVISRWALDPHRCRLASNSDTAVDAAAALGIPALHIARLTEFAVGG